MKWCEENRFCRSLKQETREKLCAQCNLRTLMKGQLAYRSDLQHWVVLIVKGVSVTPSNYDDYILEEKDRPAFFINTNGLLLCTDSLFTKEKNKYTEYVFYECLSDMTIALWNRDFVRNLFDSDVMFARCLFQNMAVAASEACEFTAMLRTGNVERSVRFMLRYAIRKNFKLSHTQIANCTGHKRTSVTRALTAIKKSDPALYLRYESLDPDCWPPKLD